MKIKDQRSNIKLLTVAITLALALPATAGFRGFLKQSTAATVKFGPIVDATDGYSPETGLTLHAAHIRLSKNGGDFASKNSASAQVHDEAGYYDVALNATDTGTMGILTVGWTDANSVVIVPQEYAVIHANEYDRMFSTGPMGTPEIRNAVRNIAKESIVPADANNNSLWDLTYLLGHALAAQPATTVAVVTDASTFTITAGSAVNNFYSAIVVEDASDSSRRAVRFIKSYTGGTKLVSLDEALPFLPVAGDPVYLQANRAVGRGRVSP